MLIGGIQRCSFSDYPGKVAAVLFSQGCNFRCPFCHNGSLLGKRGDSALEEQEVFDFLKRRKGKIQGVVITGGEPTEHIDLPQFIKRIRRLDFPIKLDTNGSHPEMIEKLLQKGLIDYLAMDIKAPLHKYDTLCGVTVDIQAICMTISIVGASKIPHHFRTTYVKQLLTENDLAELMLLLPLGSQHITQPFVPQTDW
jgi:pyruvate formate lyase activating enzyme